MFDFFEVGGCVRDSFLGVNSKDVDFVAVPENPDLFLNADFAFTHLVEHLRNTGFKVFLETPQFFTVRAQVPDGNPLKTRTNVADFVMARKDGPSSDGRRPDFVLPGTLMDDLSRRDFTVNAIARTVDDEIVDPFDGVRDIQDRKIRFVGDPMLRISEDGLRVMRAFRFFITKEFDFDIDTFDAIRTPFAAEMLSKVSVERIREELTKMFQFNTLESLDLLAQMPIHLRSAIFRDGLRLDATLAK